MSSSDSRIDALKNSVERSVGADQKYHHVALGDWQEVYSVQEVPENLWTANLHFDWPNTKFYKTNQNKGEERGYFEHKFMRGVCKVRRSLYQPWVAEKIDDAVLEYEPANESDGILTARCRVIEVYSLYDSQIVSQRHRLWGNAIEIVKALRDGYSSRDPEYQHICLGIILEHFAYMDKYLDLVPQSNCPTYKEVLHHWARKQENDDESSEEEDSGSDSE